MPNVANRSLWPDMGQTAWGGGGEKSETCSAVDPRARHLHASAIQKKAKG
nr:MAG TPA: hypothetical protein [Caudoviricetes sp.]